MLTNKNGKKKPLLPENGLKGFFYITDIISGKISFSYFKAAAADAA